MAATVEDILTDCIQQALGLPRTPLDTEVRDLALGAYNEEGRIIWDEWPWDNEKLDEFTAPTADSDGIITFASNVEVIQAVKASVTGATETTRIWNEADRIAASRGVSVSEDKFGHMADDSDGYKRIRVDPDNDASSYTVLALKRWVDATVDAAYDSSAPTATPLDYRVETFIIDGAEPALRAAIKDVLRMWDGQRPLGNRDRLLGVALRRDQLDEDRDHRINPRSPMFSEVGNWR